MGTMCQPWLPGMPIAGEYPKLVRDRLPGTDINAADYTPHIPELRSIMEDVEKALYSFKECTGDCPGHPQCTQKPLCFQSYANAERVANSFKRIPELHEKVLNNISGIKELLEEGDPDKTKWVKVRDFKKILFIEAEIPQSSCGLFYLNGYVNCNSAKDMVDVGTPEAAMRYDKWLKEFVRRNAAEWPGKKGWILREELDPPRGRRDDLKQAGCIRSIVGLPTL